MTRLGPAGGTQDTRKHGRRARRLLVAASVAASALLVACSAAATHGVPSAAPRTGAAKQTSKLLTRAQLRSALLTRSDMPAGWQRKPQDSQNNDMPRALQSRLSRCVGVHHFVDQPQLELDSPSFVRGQTVVSSSVDRYRPAQVARDIAVMHNPKVPRCLATVFRAYLPSELPPQADVTNVIVHIAKRGHRTPKDVVGVMLVSFDMSTAGRTIAAHTAETMIAKGNVEAAVDTVVFGGPVDASMQHRLGNLVAARVARL